MEHKPIILRKDYVGITIDEMRTATIETTILLTPRIRDTFSGRAVYPITGIKGKALSKNPAIFYCYDVNGTILQGRLRRNGICTFVHGNPLKR